MSAAAVPDGIDLEKLLSPISGEQPAGEELRFEGTYDRIRDARREDDATLSQGIYKTELKKADWREVERICTEALTNRTKDIQISAWLMEAWLHLRGFPGCHDGLQLLTKLIEKYWVDLHPQLNDGDPENRVGTFVWINEKLSSQLKQVAITAPQSNDVLAYSFADWEMACHLDQLAERDPNSPSAPDTDSQVSVARFQASTMLTTTESYLKLSEDLNGVAEDCKALDALLEEKLERQSPGLQRFIEIVGSIHHIVSDILRARPEEHNHLGADQNAEFSVTDSREPGSGLWGTHPIRSRAEAYWRLSEVAEYLFRTEPHSPTPYLVQRAVEWGNMSLSDLFEQIIRNEGEMQEINRLLRLTNKEEGG